jgi:hypothetical protein
MLLFMPPDQAATKVLPPGVGVIEFSLLA